MWKVRDIIYDDREYRQYKNRDPIVKEVATFSLESVYKQDKLIDTSRNAYRRQMDSLEYEDVQIFKLQQELAPFALKINYVEEDICSVIVKVYGGMRIETNGNSTTKWYLLYKKNGDVSNNSTLRLVKPKMNCERMMNLIRIHYGYGKITELLLRPVVTCFGFKTIQLQTVNNNKRLKISSKSENNRRIDYFSILPNEIIVKIFEYFDLKTLARTAQVCSSFNDIITKTDIFYYNLDFQPYWNVFSAEVFDRFMDKTKNLKKLNLGGCNEFPNAFYDLKLKEFLNGAKNTLTHLYINGTMQSYVLNENVIKAIFACKELLELHLRNIKMLKVDITFFRLFGHLDNRQWFNADIIQCKNLRKLDLSFSVVKDEELITILSKTRKLKHLILDSFNTFKVLGMGNVSGGFMELILEKLVNFDINLETWSSRKRRFTSRGLSLFKFQTNLEELDLSDGGFIEFRVPATFTLNFLAKCSRLKRLSLAGWKSVKDEHLVIVIENCKKLEQVNFSNLKLITANSIKELLKLENLKLLNISDCSQEKISLSQLEEWRKEYPQVEIRSHFLL